MKILLVEDDNPTASYVAKGLKEAGMSVQRAADGRAALDMLIGEDFDCVILDIMLPFIDGMTLLKTFRASNALTPVIMLTAKDAVEDRVRGLSGGADDYLVKPFAFSELLARIHAVTRRRAARRPPQAKLSAEDLEMDSVKHTVTRGGKSIELTKKEFSLLWLLLSHKDEVLSRTFIPERVWDINFDSGTNAVDVAVKRLRDKVDGGLRANSYIPCGGWGMSFAKWRRRAASLSLSWRLALSAFFISLVTLVAVLAAGFHAYTHMLEAEYVSQLDAYMVELSMLVDEVTEHPSQRQDEVMARWVHSELTNEHYTSLLADGEGQILDQSEHFPFSYGQFMELLPQGQPQFFLAFAGRRAFLLGRRTVFGDAGRTVMCWWRAIWEKEYRRKYRLLQASCWFTLFTAAVIGLLSFAFAKMTLSPLSRMGGYIGAITAKDLHRRLHAQSLAGGTASAGAGL